MVATVAGIHLGLDTHANRPAANTAPDGSLYSCSTHGLIYKSNFAGNSWATWASLAGSGLTDPMTTRGDMIVRNASNVTDRLARGSADTYLGSDGTDLAFSAVTDAKLSTSDITTNNASTSKHGFLKKLSNVSTEYMDGTGAWSTPAGGGGGVTVQYPGLKPGSPTYDFAGAALDGAFSANSTSGSFGTGDCKTQGEAWIGSSLEMQFSEQMGAIYVSHSNTDFDFTVGGIRKIGFGNTSSVQVMFGIAGLNSSGTGVGVVAYTDGTVYFATITTWGYTAFSTSWAVHGQSGLSDGDWWFRLARVSGTWTGYASQSGRAWDKTFATRSDSITVDRLAFGLLFTTGVAYSGRLIADYFHVAV